MSITRIKSYGLSDGAVTTEKISNNVSLGVKISNIQIANSSYSVLDDTAVALEGGYLVITGSGFAAGCQVIVGANTASSTTFVNSTTLRAQVGAADAGTKTVYVVNTDGGTAIRVNGLTYSATPTWVTGSTLSPGLVDSPVSIQLDASLATSYQLQAGSSLPAGLSLAANGLLTGTVTGIEEDTTYSFTIEAIDDENQESPRTFSLTITIENLVEYLVVAGGGGGGNRHAGGGGAGGYRTGTVLLFNSTNYTVTVGAGGSAGVADASLATNGGSSVFSSITSAGGGRGGQFSEGSYRDDRGAAGGSGGGGSNFTGITGFVDGAGGAGNTPSVSPSQGNNGGSGSGGQNWAGGGGGGAGGPGSANPNVETGGNGGPGANSSITGTSVTYAGGGGGGGGSVVGTGGAGGTGGGGAGTGGTGTQTAGSGTANRGGGGGGTRDTGTAGTGGSGVVILKYLSSLTISNPGGGLTFATSTDVPGYKVTTFTAGTGNIQFN